MTTATRLFRTILLITAAALTAGCIGSSPSARFYTITPLTMQPAAKSRAISLSIAPVEIPDYLERPQIVTHDGSNSIELSEFHRWAGSLSENISTVMAENLAQLLNSDKVFTLPRSRADRPDYLLTVRVLRLDCTPGKQVQLKAQWTLFSAKDKKELTTRMESFTESLKDDKHESIVAGISRTLEQLSRKIAQEIAHQQQGITPVPRN